MSPADAVLRVGLVGYGLSGRVFHAPLIGATPELEVSAVVTSDPRRAASAARDVPGALVVDRLDEVLSGHARVDLLVVATGNSGHVPIARRAIAARVPVVVEKPLAPNAEDGRKLVQEAEDAGVPLTVFHNRRWDGDFLTLRGLLSSGRLGAVHRFESRFERWSPALRERSWREDPDRSQGAGLLLDLGSHLLDQALVLFGPVATVYAELDRRRPASAVDDDVFVALAHANGVRSHLWVSAMAARPGPRFRVLGSSAACTCEGMDPQEQQLRDGLRPGDPGWGRRPVDGQCTVGVGGDVTSVPTAPGAYQAFYEALVPALSGQGPLPVDPWDAVQVLAVLDAARRAAETSTVAAVPHAGGRR